MARRHGSGAVRRRSDGRWEGQLRLADGSRKCVYARNFPDTEVEPMIAVDPTNPSHLVGSVQQDRWNDGGSNGLINVVSTNGGASWMLATTQPAFSICEGATAGSAGGSSTEPQIPG